MRNACLNEYGFYPETGRPPTLTLPSADGRKKGAYFGAIQAGMDKVYAPMEQLFAEIIAESLSAS